jgi:hypothetical protein
MSGLEWSGHGSGVSECESNSSWIGIVSIGNHS